MIPNPASAALNRYNHRVNWTVEETLAWYEQESVHPHQSYHDLCLGAVALAAGFAGSGTPSPATATHFALRSRSQYRHKPMSAPPPGVLICLPVAGHQGHIMTSAGGGWAWTSDFNPAHMGDGRLHCVKIQDVVYGWGLPFAFWLERDFRDAGSRNPYGPPRAPWTGGQHGGAGPVSGTVTAPPTHTAPRPVITIHPGPIVKLPPLPGTVAVPITIPKPVLTDPVTGQTGADAVAPPFVPDMPASIPKALQPWYTMGWTIVATFIHSGEALLLDAKDDITKALSEVNKP